MFNKVYFMGWDLKYSDESDKYSWAFYEDVEIPNWLLTIQDILSGKEHPVYVGHEAYENYEKITNYGIDECVESGFSNKLNQEEIEFAELLSEENQKLLNLHIEIFQ